MAVAEEDVQRRIIAPVAARPLAVAVEVNGERPFAADLNY